MSCTGFQLSASRSILLVAAALAVFLALTTLDFHGYRKALLHKLVTAVPGNGTFLESSEHASAAWEAGVAVQHETPWSSNLTDIHHHPTKYAIGILMVEADFVTFQWMDDDSLQDTTIFLVHDDDDFDSLREVGSRMYGLSVNSTSARDAGACNGVSSMSVIATWLSLGRLQGITRELIPEGS